MNKSAIFVFLIMLIMVAAVMAGHLENGAGGLFDSDNGTVRVTFASANSVKIYNSGATTQILWAAANCTTGEFETIMGSTNAIPIRGGQSWTFQRVTDDISSVCIHGRDGDGSMTADISAY